MLTHPPGFFARYVLGFSKTDPPGCPICDAYGQMTRSRFTEEQFIEILNEQESGLKVSDPCRKDWISNTTFYKWKTRYGDLEVSETKRLKAPEDENTRLKRLLADAILKWADGMQIEWPYIALGKPQQNGFCRKLQWPDQG